MSKHDPAFKVYVAKRRPGRWKFVVRDFLGATLGTGEARTQYLAKKAGNDFKRQVIKQYPGLART